LDEKDAQAAATSTLQQTVSALQQGVTTLQQTVATLQNNLIHHQQTVVTLQSTVIHQQERLVAKQEDFVAQNTALVDGADLVEKHECLALCLRGMFIIVDLGGTLNWRLGYNDFLFDLTRLPKGPGDRRMLPQEKEVLKREELGYSVLSVCIPAPS
jgi:hypothetical protein